MEKCFFKVIFESVYFGYDYSKKNEVYTLKDLNLNIESSNEFIALVGSTGSGKSTLVQLINALLLPNKGLIRTYNGIINNKVKMKLKPIRQRIGLVFQFPEYQLFEETVYKELCFGPRNFGLSNFDERINNAINAVNLDISILQKSPFTLSGGQQRKVAIASILASTPNILILDEPTAGLDPYSKKEFLKFLKQLNEELATTIILITHDMDIVSEYAKRVVVLNEGSIIYDDDNKKLFKNKEILNSANLDLPQFSKLIRTINKQLNLNFDEAKYTIDEMIQELTKNE